MLPSKSVKNGHFSEICRGSEWLTNMDLVRFAAETNLSRQNWPLYGTHPALPAREVGQLGRRQQPACANQGILMFILLNI